MSSGSIAERGNETLPLIDLESFNDDEDELESGLVSPRELTKINFRSLIGHTDEVCQPTADKANYVEFCRLSEFCFSSANFFSVFWFVCLKTS